MNHKRKRARNRRGGCKLCKPWKVNGFRTERAEGERFGDHRRRKAAAAEMRAVKRGAATAGVVACLGLFGPVALAAQGAEACPGPLHDLVTYAGTYDNAGLLGEPAVSAALDRLVGTERAHLEENLAVAGSIDLVACHLVISGNAERQGGEQMGIVAVGLGSGAVSAALRAGDDIAVFADHADVLSIPIAIRDWLAVMATGLRFRFELPPGARVLTPAGG